MKKLSIEKASKTTYGVWTDAESVEHYTTQAEATDAWHAAAQELEEGESVYIARFVDGDIDEDFPSYLAIEGGEINEYCNGERMWL